ncbi:MAG: hypothetical protein JXB24_10325 [Bacteroidales bacterium]|nr:hypothetical protein [Bacteroidales bacterium]
MQERSAKANKRQEQGGCMLNINKNTNIPLCPHCAKELKEISATSINTRFFRFNPETSEYDDTERTHVEDDNVFHCTECNTGISVKDILETIAYLMSQSKVKVHS